MASADASFPFLTKGDQHINTANDILGTFSESKTILILYNFHRDY